MDEKEKWKLFWEIHSDNPREGPGDFQSTKEAFDMLKSVPTKPMILDVGCGPGMQTMDLSRLTDGTIVAIDNHLPFLEDLDRKIRKNALSDRVTALQADMCDLHFKEGSFDVIWAEGSIYNIGFEKGYLQLRKFLKEKGYLVTSDLTWLRNDAPDAIKDYFASEYPDMKNIEDNLKIIQSAGYRCIGHFVLADLAWWCYYSPIEARVSQLRIKYRENPEALAVLEEHQREIDFFRQFSKYFGFVFYVAQVV